jgi:hypothetical protein
MHDVVAPFIVHKNPQVKLESIVWISRALPSTRTPTKKDIRTFSELMLKAVEDSSAEVREASINFFATLIKCAGESAVAPFISDIEKGKLKKIMESSKSGEAEPVKQNLVGPMIEEKAIPKAQPIEVKQSNVAAPTLLKTKTEVSFKYSDEGAEAKFIELYGETLCDQLSDSNWKTRLDGTSLKIFKCLSF